MAQHVSDHEGVSSSALNGDVEPSETRGSAYKAIATAIFLAVASAIIGYAVSFIDEHRKNQIQIVNTQIEKLYGPLYAFSVANQRAWRELHDKYRSGKTYFFDDQDKPSAELVEVWRRWMKTVFMPMNLKMESAIIENAQLLDGNRIYPSFVDLIAHVESYKATVAKWKDTDDLHDDRYRMAGENTAVIEYPIRLDACIEARLQSVLDRRDRLERSWTGLFITEPAQHFQSDCS
jgi:hypothetical protein